MRASSYVDDKTRLYLVEVPEVAAQELFDPDYLEIAFTIYPELETTRF
jgi:hypothetical protein